MTASALVRMSSEAQSANNEMHRPEHPGRMVIVEPVQPDVTGVNGRPLAAIGREFERDRWTGL